LDPSFRAELERKFQEALEKLSRADLMLYSMRHLTVDCLIPRCVAGRGVAGPFLCIIACPEFRRSCAYPHGDGAKPVGTTIAQVSGEADQVFFSISRAKGSRPRAASPRFRLAPRARVTDGRCGGYADRLPAEGRDAGKHAPSPAATANPVQIGARTGLERKAI